MILGWSEQVFTIVSELVIANENQRRPCIVILGPHDKVAMEDEIREKVGDTKNTRVVCRSGDPAEMTDLTIVAPNTARSIIVLTPPDGADADVVKAVLALLNHPGRRPEPFHIVAALRDPRNRRLAAVVGGEEVEWLHTGTLVARVIAQTCRQAGLATVCSELLNFDGDEMYFFEEPRLYGMTFSGCLFAFETKAVIGLAPHDATPVLNPSMDTVIRPGDRLVVIAEDDDQIIYTGAVTQVDEGAIVEAARTVEPPDRMLFLGWNARGADILHELDNYIPAGSSALVVADCTGGTQPPDGIGLAFALEFRPGDTTDRELLEALEPQQLHHSVLLSHSDAQRPGGRRRDAGHAPQPARHCRPRRALLLHRQRDARPAEPPPS